MENINQLKAFTGKALEKELNAMSRALKSLPETHELAPESFKEMLRAEAEEMKCGGMFNYSPRKAGQSYNAMYAERRGELTSSKLPAVLKRVLRAGFAKTNMWHHTGMFNGHMNETPFYAACDFDTDGYRNYLMNKDSIDLKRLKTKAIEGLKKTIESYRRQEMANRRYEWLKQNCVYVKRSPNAPSIVVDREMNGKYGWFNSDGKSYNLPVYYTGYELNEGANIQEYYELFKTKKNEIFQTKKRNG